MELALALSHEMLGTLLPILIYWMYSGLYVVLGKSDKYRLSRIWCLKVKLSKVCFSSSLFRLVWPPSSSRKGQGCLQRPTIIHFYHRATKFHCNAGLGYMAVFVHKYMHVNKFLYRHFHSQHHRHIVPYAFGALYNHPVEGLILDTVGGALSFLVSGMTPRTSIFFFSCVAIKTVDYHCGLWLLGNPFHKFFSNNSAYHYVHHQLYDSKYNFSQPFIVMWDKMLGTHLPYSLIKRPEGGFNMHPNQDKQDD